MRAVLRLGMAIASTGLTLGAVPVVAQSAPEATSNTPAADAIGPRELQNFNLQGAVTRPAEETPAPRSATPPPAPRSTTTSRSTPPQPSESPPSATASRGTQTQVPSAPVGEAARRSSAGASTPSSSQVPASSVTVALPPLDNFTPTSRTYSAAPAPQPGFTSEDEPTSAPLAPEHRLSLLPWLLAAAALGAGAAFLFWRNRSRVEFAGPHIDEYVAPEAPPSPRAAPARSPAPPASRAPGPAAAPSPTPAPLGIVSTRLRPSLELGFKPLRCRLDEQKVTFEFELELFNAGSAPARDVLIEATLFNAGPTQERDVGTFFASPVGKGQRIAAIPPLQRMNLRTEVSAPTSGLQRFELAGRQVIIPVIAFNALYRWGGGEGQTSVSYLLGRQTETEKLAPFRIDLGPRVFRGLAARPLPQFLRK